MNALGRQQLWLILGGAACAAALLIVHGLESFGGYLPCELCLRQREVDWTALAVAAGALLLSRRWRVAAPVGCVALGVAFAVGAVVAGYHAGVEWRWWPGPTACTGAAPKGPATAADLAAVFSGAVKLHMVRCDEAALRIAGLSLSGWNAVASAALSVVSFAAVFWRRRL